MDKWRLDISSVKPIDNSVVRTSGTFLLAFGDR